jgi:hypothetical protein
MFEGDLDGVAAMVGEADIGDDRGSAYCMLAGRELRDAGGDDVGGGWMLAGRARLASDHLGLPVGADGGCVGIELAVVGELLLGESERGVEQFVKVSLRLRGGGVWRSCGWRLRC